MGNGFGRGVLVEIDDAGHATPSVDCRTRYARAAAITGPIGADIGAPRELVPRAVRVQFRRRANRQERWALVVFAVLGLGTSLGLAGGLWSAASTAGANGAGTALGAWTVVALLGVIEALRVVQGASLWWFAWRARDPVPIAPTPHLRVALLTTIVPSREPLEMVARTLRAMRRVRYEGSVDVWILDEEDDPDVARVAAELGAKHFTRKGVPRYNRPDGPFRARTKAGNHNAWRAEHEAAYDVVAQLDPDHEPASRFLERTLGYFRDPDVAFVVAPQVYGNARESLVSRMAASMSYVFHGVVQRGGNGSAAPLLIGTNHLYRPAAWRQIGGYQDCVIEDHLTGMRVHSSRNPTTGGRWKGVYTPDVVSIGEGPGTWTDFFNQQMRWAYGVWQIVLGHSHRLLPRLTPSQRLAYALVQSFYPAVATIWVLGYLLDLGMTLLVATGGERPTVETWPLWAAAVAVHVAFFAWLRRFNLVEHERREPLRWAFGAGIVAGPVYASAAMAALLRRPLAYVVTAKGALRTEDTVRAFRLHLPWAALGVSVLALGLAIGGDAALLGWTAAGVAAAAFPPLAHAAGTARRWSGHAPRTAPTVPLLALPAGIPVGSSAVTLGWDVDVRRALDVLVSAVAIAALLPAGAVIALVIGITSRGPVLYGQQRLGRHGAQFTCWKFRTMIADAEERLPALLAASPELRWEFERDYKLRDDPRVTTVGRFLRRTSLDELPQLWNVLRGEMSIVGPRAMVAAEADRYGSALVTVLGVRPGLTGVWQVSGRNDVTYDERVMLQVQTACLRGFRDHVRLVLRTLWVVLRWRGSGAY